MFQPPKIGQILHAGFREILVTVAACLLLNGIVAAQDLPAAPSGPQLGLPAPSEVPVKISFPTFSSVKASSALSAGKQLDLVVA